MKYRSPSPSTTLPTPPRSPTIHEPTQSAVNLLDSLQAFYQQERHWVHHTRASLELALTKGIDAPPPAQVAASSPPSSAASSPDTNSISSGASDAPSIKEEPDTPPPVDVIATARKTLWMRRKAGMKLKLNGLAPAPRRRRPHRAPPSEPGARLLEMFSELVDARMESCQRISRLVRDSNRPDGFI